MDNFYILQIKKHFKRLEKNQSVFDPKKARIPLAIPPYGWEEVVDALDSLLSIQTTMGKKVKKFENAYSKYLGIKYGVMVHSGSSANLLALSTLVNSPDQNQRIQKGDEIITSPTTWATTVYPIVNIGAVPVFVDVDPLTFNIDPESIEQAITKKTKAIMLVHLLGYPCNMKKIKEIASRHNLSIIEDCCEAHGSTLFNKKVGTFGTISTFSFFATHHITTMEGGMVLTNDHKLYELAKSMRTFGWIRDLKNKNQIAKNYPKIDPRFLFFYTGFNFRPTEIQGAFGIHQLKKLDSFVNIRIDNAKFWKKELKRFSEFLQFPPTQKGYKHVYFVYPITVKKNKYFTKDQLIEILEKKGIETRPVMIGNIVRQPVSKMFKYKQKGKLTHSDSIMNNSFVIGNHQGIDKKRRKYVSDTIIEFIESKIK